VTVVGLLMAGMFADEAHAIYGPAAGGFGAELVSVDNASDEQANGSTTDAVISANGQYVVFQTKATNFFENDGGVVGAHGVEPDVEPPGTLREGGIFRYDRLTGEIQLVADGNEVHTCPPQEPSCPEKGKLIFRGAQNPSVSANGRYVVFSTAQQLVPRDNNENVDVYVRDMDVPLTADRKDSGAYKLVSAKSGSEEPADYGAASQRFPGDEPGAEVWPSTAISANGRYVVFRTSNVESDLPDQGAVTTPPQQLFVRDLQDDTTTLISRTSPGSEPGPNCGAGGTKAGGEPACGAVGPATIGADGSTVAWVSTNAPEQTAFLTGEDASDTTAYYLWRRWQEPGAKTRRITGIADPEDPECPPEGSVEAANHTASGPCYGPLTYPEGQLAPIVASAPALSEDGYTVAFLAAAALRPDVTKSIGLDAFVTSMAPGVTRKVGTRELTLGAPSGESGSTQPIESIALSPDGSTVAFTTPRDDFLLPEPTPIGSFRPLPLGSDLYVVHLREDTLERAIVNYEGGDVEGSIADDPTLTQDGSTVAFTSSASNLIYGDANRVSNAYTATLSTPTGTAVPPASFNVAQGGFSLTGAALPELGLSVKRAADGGLILLVETPGAGTLVAQANGKIVARVGKGTRKKEVVLARASGATHAEGTATLVLHMASKYAKDLKNAGRLKATITVGYKPPPPAEALSVEASATFVAASAKKGTKRSSAANGKAKKG
jgi:hypothetical protein